MCDPSEIMWSRTCMAQGCMLQLRPLRGTPGKPEVERQRAALPEGSPAQGALPGASWPGRALPLSAVAAAAPPSRLIIQSLICMK